MKAEIGFGCNAEGEPTDRLRLVITAQTETEGTSLRLFKRRMGIADPMDGMHGQLILQEGEITIDLLPESR